MFARVITFRGAEHIEDGVTFVREKVLPVISGLQGYKGLTISADRSAPLVGILSLWESEDARKASEAALNDARQEGNAVIGGQMTVENYEEVMAEMAGQPGPGAALLVQRVSMDPGVMKDNEAFFAREVAPRIKANPGFVGLRQLVDRDAGRAIVGTMWSDRSALDAALADAESRRDEARGRGVNFDDVSKREILFTDLP
jgi:heme-degrading monooxygenase HmoA